MKKTMPFCDSACVLTSTARGVTVGTSFQMILIQFMFLNIFWIYK